MKENNIKLFLQKVEAFLPDFEKRLRKKLNPHQKRNTKIRFSFEEEWIEKGDVGDVCIFISIEYSCHGKHSEGYWMYYLKRGIDFVVEKEKQVNLQNLSMQPHIYYMDDAIYLYEQGAMQPRQFTLRQLASERIIVAIAKYLNDGLLDIPAFFYCNRF